MACGGWRLLAGGLRATLLGVALLQPLGAIARGDRLQEAIAAFEQRGYVIRREHPRCAEPQLFGLYVRGQREVVVCPKGNQLETLLHEGWHGVQSLCLREKPMLGLDALLLARAPRSPGAAGALPAGEMAAGSGGSRHGP